MGNNCGVAIRTRVTYEATCDRCGHAFVGSLGNGPSPDGWLTASLTPSIVSGRPRDDLHLCPACAEQARAFLNGEEGAEPTAPDAAAVIDGGSRSGNVEGPDTASIDIDDSAQDDPTSSAACGSSDGSNVIQLRQ